MNGKGDTPRPLSVPQDEFARRWDATFGSRRPLDPWPLTAKGPLMDPHPLIEPRDTIDKLREVEMLRFAAMRDAVRFLRDGAA